MDFRGTSVHGPDMKNSKISTRGKTKINKFINKLSTYVGKAILTNLQH